MMTFKKKFSLGIGLLILSLLNIFSNGLRAMTVKEETITGDGGTQKIYTYYDKNQAFRLVPPPNWEVNTNPGRGLNLLFSAPGGNKAGISLASRAVDFSRITKEKREELKESLGKRWIDYRIVSEAECIVDGERGYAFISSGPKIFSLSGTVNSTRWYTRLHRAFMINIFLSLKYAGLPFKACVKTSDFLNF